MRAVLRKVWWAVLFAIASLAAHADDTLTGPDRAADVAAITAIVVSAYDGWATFDPVRATAEYAPDAYFFNAFGRERRGRAAIAELIGQVLRTPGYRAGRKGPLKIISVEFPAPTIALVHTLQETLGQQRADGSELGPRRSHIFRMMAKTDAGWQTQAFIVSDERPRDGQLPGVDAEPAAK
jgi:uncharacterized protein (TIGR02246 family)